MSATDDELEALRKFIEEEQVVRHLESKTKAVAE
jgi:hypothetical protein